MGQSIFRKRNLKLIRTGFATWPGPPRWARAEPSSQVALRIDESSFGMNDLSERFSKLKLFSQKASREEIWIFKRLNTILIITFAFAFIF